jgi:PucR-like helix-turn-helix protein
MTSYAAAEPLRALPADVADLIEPELEAITGEILATIAREVPEYARPLEGDFGRGIRTGVGEALSQFVALIRDPAAGRELGREVYVALGRGELRQGRTLDSLQAAYRVGARVAWRHVAEAGRRARLDSEVLSLLAEAIFAYIDELSADSVEGYAEAQSESEDRRRRQRRRLVALLTDEGPVEASALRVAVQEAGWALPRGVAALACAEADLPRLAHRLPADSLVASLEELGCALIPDPAGPGRAASIERAVVGLRASLGPVGEPPRLADSWNLARGALRALQAGRLAEGGLVRAEDHLAELLLFEAGPLVGRIGELRLSAFEALTERARQRMQETALAYICHRGNSVAMAAALHVHPQTARYRVARLRELLGDQLDDPDARFELEIALRGAAES